jgi:hypothetical protein
MELALENIQKRLDARAACQNRKYSRSHATARRATPNSLMARPTLDQAA